jgi:hypothetical protein
MRKDIIGNQPIARQSHDDVDWLDVERIARVQVISEDSAFPIENALSTNPERNELGWRAGSPGPQTIALQFDAPQKIRRLFVHFIERVAERDQEVCAALLFANGDKSGNCASAVDLQPNRLHTRD